MCWPQPIQYMNGRTAQCYAEKLCVKWFSAMLYVDKCMVLCNSLIDGQCFSKKYKRIKIVTYTAMSPTLWSVHWQTVLVVDILSCLSILIDMDIEIMCDLS